MLAIILCIIIVWISFCPFWVKRLAFFQIIFIWSLLQKFCVTKNQNHFLFANEAQNRVARLNRQSIGWGVQEERHAPRVVALGCRLATQPDFLIWIKRLVNAAPLVVAWATDVHSTNPIFNGRVKWAACKITNSGNNLRMRKLHYSSQK